MAVNSSVVSLCITALVLTFPLALTTRLTVFVTFCQQLRVDDGLVRQVLLILCQLVGVF